MGTINRMLAFVAFALVAIAGFPDRSMSPAVALGSHAIPVATRVPGSVLSTPAPALRKPIAVPNGVSLLSDAHGCIHYAAAARIGACEAAVAGHRLVIVWHWDASDCPGANDRTGPGCTKDVRGFEVLEATSVSGKRDFKQIADVPGRESRLAIVEQNATDATGSCFRVAATKGEERGPASDAYCAKPAIGSVTLRPTNLATSSIATRMMTGGLCTKLKFVPVPFPNAPGDVLVGSNRAYHSDFLHCNDGVNEFFRGALDFDFSAVRGKPLKRATLTLTVERAIVERAITTDSVPPTQSLHSCASTLGVGTSHWETATGPFAPFPMLALAPVPRNANGTVTIDATKVVARLLADHAMHGMILAGVEPAFYSSPMCESRYGSPKLTIEYAN